MKYNILSLSVEAAQVMLPLKLKAFIKELWSNLLQISACWNRLYAINDSFRFWVTDTHPYLDLTFHSIKTAYGHDTGQLCFLFVREVVAFAPPSLMLLLIDDLLPTLGKKPEEANSLKPMLHEGAGVIWAGIMNTCNFSFRFFRVLEKQSVLK